MSIQNESQNLVEQPSYYHREYKNDFNKSSDISTWSHQCKRVALVALPFVSLYKPLGLPLSLGMNGIRTFSNVMQLLESVKEGKKGDIPWHLLQTTVAVASFAGTIFAHPLGMLMTTGNDVVIDSTCLLQHLTNGEYQQALLKSADLLNNSLYLALFFHGGIELSVASLAVQVLLGLYRAREEQNKGNYLEASGHFVMMIMRGTQLRDQAQLLKLKIIMNHTKNMKHFTLESSFESNLLGSPKGNKQEGSVKILQDLSGLPNSEQTVLASKEEIILKYLKDPEPICSAAFYGDLQAVKVFAELGADLKPALHGAIMGKHLSVVKYLIDHHVCTDNALFDAALCDWWVGFDFLRKQGAKAPPDLFERICERMIDSFYFDPVRYHPVERDKQKEIYIQKALNTEILDQLIIRGIRAQVLSPSGTAWRVREGRFATVFSKLFHKNFISQDARVKIVNSLGKAGFPLNQTFFISLLFNNPKKITLFKEAGDIKDSDWVLKMGSHPVHWCHGWGGLEELIGQSLGFSTGLDFYQNTAPLQYAVLLGDVNLAEALLKAGVNPNYSGSFDLAGVKVGRGLRTPLQNAVTLGNQAMVLLLIKYNAKLSD